MRILVAGGSAFSVGESSAIWIQKATLSSEQQGDRSALEEIDAIGTSDIVMNALDRESVGL